MTAADPRRDRLNRIASACPQCAGYKPQRSEAASTNELHTAIAAAEDVVDPHAAPTDQPARTLAATVAALDRAGSDIPIDQRTRDGACGPDAAAGALHGTTTPAAGRTDAPVLVELAKLCIAMHDARRAYHANPTPTRPKCCAGPNEWVEYGLATQREDMLLAMSASSQDATIAFVKANVDAIVAAIDSAMGGAA